MSEGKKKLLDKLGKIELIHSPVTGKRGPVIKKKVEFTDEEIAAIRKFYLDAK